MMDRKASFLYGILWHTMTAVFLLLPLSINVQPVSSAGIDCFKCVSLNGSNPMCEDPFHNNYTTDILERPCMGGRKGRNGLFPASSCIKVVGKYSDGSGTIMIRGCSLDSGTLTTDTELIRMSHCGSFFFNEKYVYGCVQSCDDVDACNAASTITTPLFLEMFYQRFISHLFLLFIFLYLSRETKIVQYCTPWGS